MPAKQATLGKFFGNPNGAKAAPQQSKLAFSTKSKKKEEVEKDGDGEAEPVASNGHGKVERNGKDTAKEEDEDVQMKEAENESDSGSDVPTAAKKRKAKDDEQDALKRKEKIDDEEEDSPPAKKARTTKPQKSEKPVSNGKKPRDQPKKKPVDDTSDKSEEEEVKPAKSKKAKSAPPQDKQKNVKIKATKSKTPDVEQSKKRGKPVKKASLESEGQEDDDEPAKPSPPVKTKKQPAVTSPDADNDSVSESDAEQELSEDDDPAAAVESQQKLSKAIKGTGKDLYPDWKAGDPVPYAALCKTFSAIEMTTKRLEISALCSKFLQQVMRLTPDDLTVVVLLMIGKLAADYNGIELGIGESLIMKAIGETTGRSLSIIKADQKEIGDLGLVAAKSRSNQPTMFKPKPLTVRGVHEALMVIAKTEGKGAQDRKVGGIKKLLSAADANLAGKGSKGIDITKDKGGPSESKYIIRLLEGKMRLGLAGQTVLIALASAAVTHESHASSGGEEPGVQKLADGERMLKSVFSELPSYEVVIPEMMKHGIMNLKDHCKLRAGVPLKPMLAKPTKSITEVLDRFDGKKFSCEYKYDGERAQIHYVAKDSDEKFATAAPSEGESTRGVSNIFSRNSEDLSKKYPDILQRLPAWVKASTKSFVLDCETVAWDVKQKKVLPFQQLMTRKRKDVKAEEVTVQVCVFAFDLLYLNGEALVNKTFRERRDALREAFNEVDGEFRFAQYGDANELDEIQQLLEDSVKASCEGLMVKMLDGPESSYEPSKRSQNWLKVKKDYLAGVGDSLDLVVLGAYFGRGKRTSWYGAFLLACYNPSSERYETVCNIGTGFSEAILEEFHTKLKEHEIERPKPFYLHSAGNKDQPDVWFEPKFVWEVKTADLTLSPRYKAAADALGGSGGGKGISLRFPRFIKERDDKKPEQATSSRQVAEMYQKQESVAKSKGPAVDDDFEY